MTSSGKYSSRLGAVVLGFAVLLAGRSAVAGDKVVADALFQQARQLMNEGKYDEACKKFDASNRVDPAVGTQLNLALCLKQAGKTASAWSAYRSAAAAARDHGQADRQRAALAEADALQAQLQYVTIVVPEAARVPGLHVMMDDLEVVPSLWGTAFPADPGSYQVTFTADGYQTAELALDVKEKNTQLEAPVLQKLLEAEAQPAPAPAAAQPEPAAPEPAMPPPPPPETDYTPVWIAGGATVLMAAGVGVTGALYLSERSSFDELNSDPSASPGDRQAAYDSADTINVVNLVLIGATVVGAGVTGYLWFSAEPEAPADTARGVSRAPWATASSGGVVIGGRL